MFQDVYLNGALNYKLESPCLKYLPGEPPNFVNKTYLPAIDRANKKKAENELNYYLSLKESFNPNSRIHKPEFRGERSLIEERQRI